MRPGRPLLLPALLALALVPAAPAAAAVSSEVSGGTLTIAGTAERDTVIVDCSGGAVKVNGLDPGSGAALCADIDAVEISVEGGNDLVILAGLDAEAYPSLTSITVDAGDGADDVLGSPLGDTLLGGPGTDALTPGAGTNHVDGGTDEDRMYVNGTSGVTVTRGRLIEGDDVTRHTSIEEVHIATAVRGVRIDTTRYRGRAYVSAGDGPDKILLGRGNDNANGGGGRDRILGGGGLDHLLGGSGRDLLKGQAGNDDHVGGPGRDRCYGGPGGDQFASCEIAVE